MSLESITIPAEKPPDTVNPIASLDTGSAPMPTVPLNLALWELLEVTCNGKPGAAKPMPTFPALVTLNKDIPEEEVMLNGFTALEPVTDNLASGVVVPMPTKSVDVAL